MNSPMLAAMLTMPTRWHGRRKPTSQSVWAMTNLHPMMIAPADRLSHSFIARIRTNHQFPGSGAALSAPFFLRKPQFVGIISESLYLLFSGDRLRWKCKFYMLQDSHAEYPISGMGEWGEKPRERVTVMLPRRRSVRMPRLFWKFLPTPGADRTSRVFCALFASVRLA